jgi:TIR domain
MDIFLSWSGQRSKMVAGALRKWLPSVIQSVEPWVSGADIEAGTRWHQALSVQLNQCNFGIICLTPENLGSSWLLYEAGALSKVVEGSSVVPYLLDLRKVDVDGPLAHFQSAEADEEGTYFLLKAMNAVLPRLNKRALADDMLRQTFALWWPQLEGTLQSALDTQVSSPVEPRSSDQMIQELVENTRSIAGIVTTLANRLEGNPKPAASQLPEVLEATRTALAKVFNDIYGDLDISSDNHGIGRGIEDHIDSWERRTDSSEATFETLNDGLRNMKAVRTFLQQKRDERRKGVEQTPPP